MPSYSRTKTQLIGMNATQIAFSPLEFRREVIAVPYRGFCLWFTFIILCSFNRVLERGGLWHRKPAPCETPRQLWVTINETCCALKPLINAWQSSCAEYTRTFVNWERSRRGRRDIHRGFWWGNMKVRRHLGRTASRWEDYIKLDFK